MMLSRQHHALLVNCLEQCARPLGASAHFTLYLLPPAPPDTFADEFIIVHAFDPARIDNNLGYYVVTELLPLLAANQNNIVSADYSEQDIFERSVGDIVRSMAGDEHRAWRLFYDNTLAVLQTSAGLRQPRGLPDETATDFIGHFGAIYRRSLDLIEALPAAPQSLTVLDMATCFGFFPLLLARSRESSDKLGDITGGDLNPALVGFANDYARHCHHDQVRFGTADILADDIEREMAPLPARFDVATALHLLEHLEPWQTETAVANLWRLTARRLIIAIPLEETPDPRFGHRQVFDRTRLSAIGRQLGGNYHYDEYHGGWLVVDRHH